MADHPQRPPRPGRAIPLKGDDNSAWLAWHNQCQACGWAKGKRCLRYGQFVYGNGHVRDAGAQGPGGCSSWRPREVARG
jgi:hypothetical protein